MNTSKTTSQNQDSAQAQDLAAVNAMQRAYVGNYIMQLMQSVNWTPADLCRYADMNSGNLSKVLRGERGITAYHLLRIQEAVAKEREIRRQRASFLDETSRSLHRSYVDPLCERMTSDGLSQDKVDGVYESVTGIIKSAYAP